MTLKHLIELYNLKSQAAQVGHTVEVTGSRVRRVVVRNRLGQYVNLSFFQA